MSVWIVTTGEYETGETVGVFTDELVSGGWKWTHTLGRP